MRVRLCDGGSSNAKFFDSLRMLALRAIQRAITSDLFASTKPEAQVELVAGAILGNLVEPTAGSLEVLQTECVTDCGCTEPSSASRRAPLLDVDHEATVSSQPTHKRARSFRGEHAGEQEKQQMVDVVQLEALRTLRLIARTSQTVQVTRLAQAVCQWLDRPAARKEGSASKWVDAGWCCWLATVLLQWTQLQYRFALISALAARLLDQGDTQATDAHHATLLAMITAAFNSQISLLGLDTSDILAQLLGLIQRRSAFGPDDPLLPPLVACVASLGTHNYYPQQVADLIQDIVSNINAPSTQSLPPTHRSALIQSQLHSIVGIITQSQSGEGQPFTIKPTVFEEGLYLWTDANDQGVRSATAQVLAKLLSQDLTAAHAELKPFFDAVHATAFSLAMGRRVSSPRPSTSTPSGESASSDSNDDRSGSTAFLPSAMDFAGIKQVLLATHRFRSATATLSAVPMLYKLEAEGGAVWDGHVRRKACRQILLAVTGSLLVAWEQYTDASCFEQVRSWLRARRYSHRLRSRFWGRRTSFMRTARCPF
jgi:hypothetical protein